jgi:hypothetical protein
MSEVRVDGRTESSNKTWEEESCLESWDGYGQDDRSRSTRDSVKAASSPINRGVAEEIAMTV